ncbi:MAG: DNA-processing protein DprA [Stygiobacter sp.]
MNERKFLDLVYLKLFLSIEGIGPQKIFNLLSKFHSFENIFNSSKKELLEVDGINSTLSEKILISKNNFNLIKSKFESELNELEKLNGFIISFFDKDYPELLKNIYFPPLILYGIGDKSIINTNCIAIVGTRMPSSYGKGVAEKFSTELCSKDFTIVSGLARGIDSIVHRSVLNNNGKTIAVIGTGLDIIYPPENKNLFEQIKSEGLIITEFEFGTKPDAQNFPRRNRIVSGLSLGTLVVETKISGGALITAAYALEQGREVFSIPGQINSKQSEGTNSLIQKGEAKLVTCVEDILNELNVFSKEAKQAISVKVDLTLFEEKIFNLLDSTPKHIDEIARLTNLSTSECLVHLLTLEFKGLVKQLPGKMFVIC